MIKEGLKVARMNSKSIRNNHEKRIDMKIGFLCSNKCSFCVQGRKRDSFGNKTYSQIIEEIKKGRMDGNEIVFTGGEATIHKDFLRAVAFAKKIGFRKIAIQTNGRMFSYKDFCIKTIAAGANEFCVGIHGHTQKIHDCLTNVQGSYKQTIQGIINLRSLEATVLTNTVITSLNYKTLPNIAKLLVSLNVNQFQFAFPHILGEAWENRRWLIPEKTSVMNYIKKGLDIGIQANIRVMTEGIPYCLMNEYENFIAEQYIPNTEVFDADFCVKNYSTYRKKKGKIKNSTCILCKYYNICEGPWREYPELFGWSEFKPIKL